MLKRQRPPTPPPALATLPATPDFNFSNQDTLSRDVKRRRIVAPILDGRERGRQQCSEGWPDEDEQEEIFDASGNGAGGVSEWMEHAGHYKHANALLHQLHLEQQRRLQVLPSRSPYHRPRGDDDTLFPQGQLAKPAHLRTPARLHEWPHHSVQADPEDVNVMEELNQVRARYEEQNRLLGLLVRQRKQEQSNDSSS